jgi:hypothetical protein
MRKEIIAAVFGLCLTAAPLPAQTAPDTALAAPPTPAPREGFFRENYPDPAKAGLLSLAIPGAGQVYNGRWWKLPFVYGAIGGMVYLIRFNDGIYQRMQTAYQAKLRDEPHEFEGTRLDNARALRSLRDSYDKNRQLSYFGLGLVYVLNGVEAFVDAHLKNFDISDDLSLRLRPVFIPAAPGQGAPVMGLGLIVPLQKGNSPAQMISPIP